MKPIYKADDGAEFETPAEVEAHNKFLKAKDLFGKAWDELRKTEFGKLKTADGYLLSDQGEGWFKGRYYLVQYEYSLQPSILEVSLYPSKVHSFSVAADGIEIYIDHYNMRDTVTIRFHLKDLYRKKENANKRIVEILKRNIELCEAQIIELEK